MVVAVADVVVEKGIAVEVMGVCCVISRGVFVLSSLQHRTPSERDVSSNVTQTFSPKLLLEAGATSNPSTIPFLPQESEVQTLAVSSMQPDPRATSANNSPAVHRRAPTISHCRCAAA